MNKQAVLKRLQQLEQVHEMPELVHVHELVQTDQTEIKYIGMNSRGHHLWEVPEHLEKDSFGKILDERFDAALSEQFKNQGRVIPLHIIGTPEQANE
jgi:hypothetical protein